MDINPATFEQQKAMSGYTYEWRKPLILTEDFLREQHIPFCQVTDPLEKAGSEEQLFYVLDGHMTPEGCRSVAKILGNYLMVHCFSDKYSANHQ